MDAMPVNHPVESNDRIAPTKSHGSYQIHIDGLRGIAVTAVVLFHAGLWPVGGGFLGVDVFFVISGYLIGGIVLAEAWDKQFRIDRFYARRLRRIVPALLVVVLATLVVGYAILGPGDYKQLAATAMTAMLGFSNISFWRFQDYFNADAKSFPLLMTWSLGVEEQFYLFCPIIIAIVCRFAKKHLLSVLCALGLLSFGMSLYLTYAAPQTAFYLIPARAWELGAGVILAQIQRDKARPYFRVITSVALNILSGLGLALITASLLVFTTQTPVPGFAAILPVGGTVLLIAARDSWIANRILSHPALRYLGKVSYSWYLIHWPLMSFVSIISIAPVPVSVMLSCAVVSLGLAHLSWRYIETPFRHPVLPTPKILVAYAASLATVVLAAGMIKMTGGLGGRLSPAAQTVDNIVAKGRGNCLAPRQVAHPGQGGYCADAISSRPRIALVGDSHAAALEPAIYGIARRSRWDVSIWAKSSCPPLGRFQNDSTTDAVAIANCSAYMKDAYQAILQDPSIQVVVLAADWNDGTRGMSASDIEGNLFSAVGQLRQSGKRVILLGDVPHWTFDPIHVAYAESVPTRKTLARALAFLSGISYPNLGRSTDIVPQRPDVTIALERVAGQTGAQYFPLAAQLCNRNQCAFSDGTKPLFIDHHHLTAAGAGMVLRGLMLPQPG